MDFSADFLFDNDILNYENIAWTEFKDEFDNEAYRPKGQMLNYAMSEKRKTLLKKYPEMKKYTEVYDMLQDKITEVYQKNYDEAKYLYRGTDQEELRSILGHGLGPEGGQFGYANFSTNDDEARRFAKWQPDPIMIRVHKEESKPYTVSQGYTMGYRGDASDIEVNTSQGWKFFREQEHRIFTDKDQLKIDVLFMNKDIASDMIEIMRDNYSNSNTVRSVHFGDWED